MRISGILSEDPNSKLTFDRGNQQQWENMAGFHGKAEQRLNGLHRQSNALQNDPKLKGTDAEARFSPKTALTVSTQTNFFVIYVPNCLSSAFRQTPLLHFRSPCLRFRTCKQTCMPRLELSIPSHLHQPYAVAPFESTVL